MALFGYDQGIFSGAIVTDNFLEVHGLHGPTKTKTLSTAIAIYNVGCFIGAMMAFPLGQKLGRKGSVALGTVLMAVGTIIQLLSYSLMQMFTGRFVLGFVTESVIWFITYMDSVGNGINTTAIPIWQAETARPKWRRKLLLLEILMSIFGFMLGNWMGYFSSLCPDASFSWRFPIDCQSFFVFVLSITMQCVPESSRFLIQRGRETEAIEALARIQNMAVDDFYLTKQRNEKTTSVTTHLAGRTSSSGRTKKTTQRLSIGSFSV
ncbi:sugar transporter [Aspergillus sclerotialis]|uniref:Sugar transporter n=1 Tax=Aspergillus sclerotialis TaxID=2070753 RepID=A0A3A2ZRU9_9EURO|nr:sugar transporter [Aspergillus sclerotialis]